MHTRTLAPKLLAVCFALAACTSAPTAPPEPSVRPGVNDRFLDPELAVDEFVEIFEGESREISVHREAIAAALDLAPGEEIADIGAGTGLFLDLFDRAVGPTGRVVAVDISPAFLEHLDERIRADGLASTETHLGGEREVGLPPRSVDVVFICDTYHHFEFPRTTMNSIRAAMRPGGRLYVVDFERIPGVSREWTLGHVRADKQTFTAEIVDAGFVLEREIDVPGLEENYMLEFRRP